MICFKDEHECQCECRPFAVYEPSSVATNVISRGNRQFEGQTFNGPVGTVNGSPGQGFEGQTFNGPVGSFTSDIVQGQTSGVVSSTTGSSDFSQLEEFVNILGIKYRGHYFNMHLI